MSGFATPSKRSLIERWSGWFKSAAEPTALACDQTSTICVAPDAGVIRSTLEATDGASIVIGAGAKIEGYVIRVRRGCLTIGPYAVLLAITPHRPEIVIEDGTVTIGDHSVLKADVSVRFGGELTIGSYSAVNQGTSLRCDERISIGDFVMVSYECLIFDTNTHELLPEAERRARTVEDFPWIGREISKPATKPVTIEDDAWIGQRAVILKGATVRKQAIVGAAAVVTGEVLAGHIAVGNPASNFKRGSGEAEG
jgi:acetyltransferase-like isoleucine patch superfamily enzyme